MTFTAVDVGKLIHFVEKIRYPSLFQQPDRPRMFFFIKKNFFICFKNQNRRNKKSLIDCGHDRGIFMKLHVVNDIKLFCLQ
jgi:hypothetical protein